MNTLSEFSIDAVRLAINFTIVGLFAALSVALAFRFALNVHPRIRHTVGVAVFFAAVVFPVFATFQIFPKDKTPILIVENSQAKISENANSETSGQLQIQPILGELPPADIVLNEISPSRRLNLAVSPTLAIVFLSLWFIVAVSLFVRETAGHFALFKARRKWQPADEDVRRKLEIPGDVPLYLSDNENPFAIGIFKPAIVLPARLFDDLTTEAARQIARHELNHLQWRDPLVNAALRVIRALSWINLPLWYLERVVRLEREAAADFAVLKNDNFDSETIAEYANTLVAVAKWSAGFDKQRRFKFVATEAGGSSGLERRVRRLFQTSTRVNRFRLSLAVLAFCGIVCGVYFLPLASAAANSSDIAVIVTESGDESFSESTPRENATPEISNRSNVLTRTTNRASEFLAQIWQVGRQESKQTTIETEKTNLNENQAKQTVLSGENISLEIAKTDAQTVAVPTPPIEQVTQRSEQSESQNFEAGPNFLRDGMASVGYPNLSDEELAALKKAVVSHFTVRDLASVGYTDLPVKTLIRLRENTVTAAYIREMKALGYDNLSPDTLCDFRWYGVSVTYAAEMAAMGYGNLSAKMILAFRRNAVSVVYIKEMQSLVKGDISVNEIEDMKWLGVNRQFIEELRSLGYENLTADQLTSMRRQGVTTAFIKEIGLQVSGNISANQLISLRQLAITPQFVKELNALGYERLTANQLSDMKRHGVTIAFIQKMRARDSKDYSIHDLISMRMSGER